MSFPCIQCLKTFSNKEHLTPTLSACLLDEVPGLVERLCCVRRDGSTSRSCRYLALALTPAAA